MAEVERQLRLLRFENFEVDLRSGELRKAGVKLKFGGQPFQVLSILLERPGDLVTREELQNRLWPDTFVDVDHNLVAWQMCRQRPEIPSWVGGAAASPDFLRLRGGVFSRVVLGNLLLDILDGELQLVRR